MFLLHLLKHTLMPLHTSESLHTAVCMTHWPYCWEGEWSSWLPVGLVPGQAGPMAPGTGPSLVTSFRRGQQAAGVRGQGQGQQAAQGHSPKAS